MRARLPKLLNALRDLDDERMRRDNGRGRRIFVAHGDDILMGATGERTVTDVTKPGDLLFLGEVAVVSRAKLETVRFWIKQGKLRSIRPGRRRLVRREDLEAFLAGSENTRRGA